MISRPTVFVLGAGASQPYGFPLGSGLRDLILDPLSRVPLRDRVATITPFRVAESLDLADEYRNFISALRTSGYSSVDQFLEKNRPLTQVGTLAIACALLPCEQENRLFPPRSPRRDHWYEMFAEILNVGSADYLRNNVTVISFNYDRSLEHYLSRVITTRLSGASPATISRHLSHVPLIHVHGQLGTLSDAYDPRKGSVPYNSPLTVERALTASRAISVIHATRPDTAAFKVARQALRLTELIYFIGFGYYRLNVARLGLFRRPWPKKWRATRVVRGTSVRIGDRDWTRPCRSTLNGAMPERPRHRGSISSFLRDVVDAD